MDEEIKQLLDQDIPEHITLSDRQKNQILQAAHSRINEGNPARSVLLKPLMAGAAIIGLIAFLGIPFIQDNLAQQGATESPEKVTIPDVEYDSLINAEYVDATNEMVYTDRESIYAYSVTSKSKQQLIMPKENTKIFDLAVNENWLAWKENSTRTLNILNRHTNEIKTVPDTDIMSLQIEGNTLTFMSFDSEDKYANYVQMDLKTFEMKEIHKLKGEGTNSKAAHDNGQLVIPERFTIDSKTNVTFFIYDLKSNKKIGMYTVPYEYAGNLTFTDNKIYAEVGNEDDASELAYVDLENGKLQKIDTPSFEAFAVYQNFLALSIPNGLDSNTVMIYKIEDNRTVKLWPFKKVKERLVKQRFTKNGTLVVNGEGQERSMYLWKVGESGE